MPNKLKRSYPTEAAVPANLKGAYAKADESDEWILVELDDDVPIVQAKKSLEETQRTLKEDLRKANEAKTRAEVNQLPAGKVAVDIEIETLGNAAKAAELTVEEIPTLKTAKTDLEGQLEAVIGERLIEEVAKANGLNEKFVELAKDKKLKFEKKVEKDEEQKDIDVWHVVGEKDGKPDNTKLDKFFETDSFFSKFADTFVSSEGGEGGNGTKQWVSQESGKGGKGTSGATQTINNRYGGTVASLTKTEDK